MTSRMKYILQGIGVLMLFFFTAGILLPWVISTLVMPLWMIIFTVGAVTALWVILLETPFFKLVDVIRSFLSGEADNVD
jgi:hypothetical protein